METRFCPNCKKERTLDYYHKDPVGTLQKNGWCKFCIRKHRAEKSKKSYKNTYKKRYEEKSKNAASRKEKKGHVNKEKRNEWRREHRRINNDEIREKEREYERRYRKENKEKYLFISTRARLKMKYKVGYVPDEIVLLKRAMIEAKEEIKKQKGVNKNG